MFKSCVDLASAAAALAASIKVSVTAFKPKPIPTAPRVLLRPEKPDLALRKPESSNLDKSLIITDISRAFYLQVWNTFRKSILLHAPY